MERYWRIAIAVANTHLEEFMSDLVGDAHLILEIADEIRQTANAKLWLFRYQNWDENDALIKQLLSSLFKLPDSAYLYIASKKPSMYKIKCRGLLRAIEEFRTEYETRTGTFFENLNF